MYTYSFPGAELFQFFIKTMSIMLDWLCDVTVAKFQFFIKTMCFMMKGERKTCGEFQFFIKTMRMKYVPDSSDRTLSGFNSS